MKQTQSAVPTNPSAASIGRDRREKSEITDIRRFCFCFLGTPILTSLPLLSMVHLVCYIFLEGHIPNKNSARSEIGTWSLGAEGQIFGVLRRVPLALCTATYSTGDWGCKPPQRGRAETRARHRGLPRTTTHHPPPTAHHRREHAPRRGPLQAASSRRSTAAGPMTGASPMCDFRTRGHQDTTQIEGGGLARV